MFPLSDGSGKEKKGEEMEENEEDKKVVLYHAVSLK